MSEDPTVFEQLAELKKKESTDWERIRKTVAVLTASQTMWRQLAPGQPRAHLCSACLKQLNEMQLPLPPSFDLLMQAEAKKVQAPPPPGAPETKVAAAAPSAMPSGSAASSGGVAGGAGAGAPAKKVPAKKHGK